MLESQVAGSLCYIQLIACMHDHLIRCDHIAKKQDTKQKTNSLYI